MVVWIREGVGRGARVPYASLTRLETPRAVENVGKTAYWEAFQNRGVDSKSIFASEGARS